VSYPGLLTQTCTVWPPQTPDGHEVPANPPVQHIVRWQDKVARAYDGQGREYTSRAILYFSEPPAVDSFVVQGSSALADPVDAGAIRIRTVERSQSPGGGIVVYKATCG
jgi:hypothetical protein